MSSNQPAIEVRHVRKVFPVYERPHHRLMQMISRGERKRRWYKEFVALDGVTFEVDKGETLGIVGRNGSGKSTLLQVICGTQAPTTGDVVVRGRVAALLELGSGFNPEFTGRENVFLNGVVLGLDRREVERRFDIIAAFADIGDFMDRPVRTYSSGMYVRLAFAVAINVAPEILIVDEALSVGDEAFQRKCFSRINQMREEGVTVLFVSHSASTVTELCNRAILLDRGELLTTGSPKYVVSRYQKLLYSAADRVESARNAIRSGKEGDASDVVEAGGRGIDGTEGAPATAQVAGASAAATVSERPQDDALECFYEEGMLPASTFRYDPAGAVIEDPHVETIGGRRVNVLKAGREYIYTYRVRFDRAAGYVRCGMLIKSVRGLELAGTVTSWSGETLPFVAEGTVLQVRFRFPCMFASGAYFLNAGVQGRLDDEEIYLDRCIDIAMFKVIHESGNLATTMMDLGIQARVEVLESQGSCV